MKYLLHPAFMSLFITNFSYSAEDLPIINEDGRLFPDFPNEIATHILEYLDEKELVHKISTLNTQHFYHIMGIDLSDPDAKPILGFLWKQGGIKSVNRSPSSSSTHSLQTLLSDPIQSSSIPLPKHIWYNLKVIYELDYTWWPYLKESHIKKVGLGQALPTDEELKALAKHLEGTMITHVNLGGKSIGDSKAIAFAEALSHTPVKSLCLNKSGLSEAGTTLVLHSLKNSNIEKINLSFNNFYSTTFDIITPTLKNSNLKDLDLSSNIISDDKLENLGKSLENSKIKALNLFGTHLQRDGIKKLLTHLKKSPSLKRLSLAYNNLNNFEIIDYLIVGCIGSNIDTLNLSLVQISPEGLQILSEKLKYTKIKHLILNGNDITTAQAALLIKGLKGSSVKALKLASNKISELDINKLVEAFETTDITTLDLGDNTLPFWCLAKLRHITHTSLTHLNVGPQDPPLTPVQKETLQRRVPFLKWTFSSDITPEEDPFSF